MTKPALSKFRRGTPGSRSSVLFPFRRTGAYLGLAIALLGMTACAGTRWGDRVQTSLEQDPQLQTDSAPAPTPELPEEIPVYPNATPQPVPIDLVLPNEPFGELTYWGTNDAPADVEGFYQQAFQQDGWTTAGQFTPDPDRESSESSRSSESSESSDSPSPPQAAQEGSESPENEPPASSARDRGEPLQTLAAQQGELEVIVTLLPDQADSEFSTHFAIQYREGSANQDAATDTEADPGDSGDTAESANGTDAATDAAATDGTDNPTTAAPGFSLPTGDRPAPGSHSSPQAGTAQTPPELRPYVQDVLALDVLKANPTASSSTAAIAPNQPVTRRQFARWLVAANNQYYASQPGEQIRLAVATAEPIFSDIPASDPDFGAIQGLAEAGVLPSPLTGNSTAVAFRPDAPLTRADLLTWKVPLDLRQTLPAGSVDAVRQAWGFQDAAQITAPTLGAVLGDRQAGEFANIKRVFGYTTLFQPNKPVTQAEAAAALWRIGTLSNGISAADQLAQTN